MSSQASRTTTTTKKKLTYAAHQKVITNMAV